MELRFSPLFSGSSGNAIYVGCDSTHLLVDAGMSGTRIIHALDEIGIDPKSLSAVLVTHEHIDHVRGIGVLSRKYDLPIFATEGTWEAIGTKYGAIADKNRCILEPEINFFLGDIEVTPFPIPHDAAQPVGYRFELERARFSVATDIGCLRDSWMKYALGSDAIVLESNYDPDMLIAGPYRYSLKKRILSRKGHLSNNDASEAAVQLAQSGTRQIVLGHLSKENNFPELALQCTTQALESEGYRVGEDIRVQVALRDAVTGIFSVTADLEAL